MSDKIIPIKYTSRNFSSIKNDLIEHARRYYPDSYKDFNEGSFGSLMIDTVSYVGDILSFYLDYQANECFLDTAIEYGNILKIAKQLGYKHINGRSTSCVATFYVSVPSVIGGDEPDLSYAPIIKKGSTFSSRSGTSFILTEDVNFRAAAKNNSNVTFFKTNGNVPISYAIRAYGTLVSGVIRTDVISVAEYKKFLKIELSQPGVVEILSVLDSEGNEYYEVDHLSQNVVYKSITNRDIVTNRQVKEILKPFIVPRRFTVESNNEFSYLQFGASSDVVKDTSNYLTDPASTILEMTGKEYIHSDSFDPTRILSTDKLGISPSNTTLTITYRYNSQGTQLNFPSDSITDINLANFIFEDEQSLNVFRVNEVKSSLELTNEVPVKGDVSSTNVDELKIRIKDYFAAQNRAVTLEDYKAMCYSMPPKYGSVKRINIIKDSKSSKRNLNLYILSQNDNGHLDFANEILKQNLRLWLSKNKMINDTIDILDGKIVNYSIVFTAVGSNSKSKYDILTDAIEQLKKDFSLKKDFGEPISRMDVFSSLKKVQDIVDVVSVDFLPKTDLGIYSTTTFDFDRQTTPDGRFINVPDNVIMEIKYPNSDIKGTII